MLDDGSARFADIVSIRYLSSSTASGRSSRSNERREAGVISAVRLAASATTEIAGTWGANAASAASTSPGPYSANPCADLLLAHDGPAPGHQQHAFLLFALDDDRLAVPMVAVFEPGLEPLSQRLEPGQPVQLAHGVIDGKPEQHFPGLVGFSMLPIPLGDAARG